MKISKSIINGSLFSIFSFIDKGFTFILLIILAKFILPDDYGELSLFNTVVTFLGYFIALSCTGYESISYFQKDRNEYYKDFTAIHIIASIVLVFLALIILIFGEPLSELLSLTQQLLWVALFISYASVFLTMVLSYYRVTQKVIKYGLVSCSGAILNFFLTLLLVISFAQGWKGRVYSQLLCGVVFAFIAFYICYNHGLFKIDRQSKERFKSIIVWGVPLIPHMAAIWIRQGLDRYIIDGCHTKADVGFFSFALNLTNIIIMIGSSFNNSFSVEIYQTLSSDRNGDEKKKMLFSKSKKMALVFLVATICVVLGCMILIPIALPSYIDSLPYFAILAIYGFIQCLYFLVVNYLFYFKHNKEIMYITFGTSILHLILSLVLTKYNLLYTCLIYVFIQLMIVGIIFMRSKKVLQENL